MARPIKLQLAVQQAMQPGTHKMAMRYFFRTAAQPQQRAIKMAQTHAYLSPIQPGQPQTRPGTTQTKARQALTQRAAQAIHLLAQTL